MTSPLSTFDLTTPEGIRQSGAIAMARGGDDADGVRARHRQRSGAL